MQRSFLCSGLQKPYNLLNKFTWKDSEVKIFYLIVPKNHRSSNGFELDCIIPEYQEINFEIWFLNGSRINIYNYGIDVYTMYMRERYMVTCYLMLLLTVILFLIYRMQYYSGIFY